MILMHLDTELKNTLKVEFDFMSRYQLHVKIKTDEHLFESVQVKIHVLSNLPAALLAYVVVNLTTIRSRPDHDSPDNDQLILHVFFLFPCIILLKTAQIIY